MWVFLWLLDSDVVARQVVLLNWGRVKKWLEGGRFVLR
jgi:hypothetical protein